MDTPAALQERASTATLTVLERRSGAARSASSFAAAARAENTKRAYRAAWADFVGWCEDLQLTSLPATPETVAMYLSDRSKQLKVGTLRHRLAAISVAHAAAGHEPPTALRREPLRSVWAGIRRSLDGRPVRKAPLTGDLLHRFLLDLDLDSRDPARRLRAFRDRALVLVGFAGAFRRSELVAIRVQDLTFEAKGVLVSIPRSKTDPGGAGDIVGIPFASRSTTCPVHALRAWLDAAGIAEGPVFRGVLHGGHLTGALSTEVVARTIKKYAGRLGLDVEAFSGHSLRAGLITSAAAAKVSEHDIARQSRHRSTAVLRAYIRKATMWDGNAASAVLG